jgi:hypothetical protein
VKIIMYAIAVAVLTGCASLPSASEAYLEQAMATPLHYSVGHDKSEVVWGRAQAFLRRYTPARLIRATRYVIQTYKTPDSVSDLYAYHATRTPGRHKDRFTFVRKPPPSDWLELRAFRWGRASAKTAVDEDSHIFSYYAKTGIAPPPSLFSFMYSR